MYTVSLVLMMMKILLFSTSEVDSSLGGSVTQASWYGANFHGRETASGVPYDMNAMTFACVSLPMGAIVQFECLETGILCVGRKTDTGPFATDEDGYADMDDLRAHPTRMFDLSREMAYELSGGNLDMGVYHVRWQVIGRDVRGLEHYYL